MPKDTHLVSGRAEILICIYFSVRNKISDMVLKTQSLNFGNDKNLNRLKRKKAKERAETENGGCLCVAWGGERRPTKRSNGNRKM